MFSRSICIVPFILAVSIVSVSAAPSLLVTVTGPLAVSDILDLRITTTIQNTGDETITLLEDPHGPLSSFPTNSFTITNENNASPAFVGLMLKYDPELAVKNGEVIRLASGETKIVKHDLFEAYDFSTSGPGSYVIEAHSTFLMVKGNKLEPIRATSQVHSMLLIGPLTFPDAWDPFFKSDSDHATFDDCSSDQQTQILAAAKVAKEAAWESHRYLLKNRQKNPRYNTWFGTFDDERFTTVLGHFERIASEDFSKYTYVCHAAEKCGSSSSVIAYVYPSSHGIIHLCSPFWKKPLDGHHSRVGTLIHEASHFTVVADTDDIEDPDGKKYYGHVNCKDLARKSPERAIHNADNHSFFAENDETLLEQVVEVIGDATLNPGGLIVKIWNLLPRPHVSSSWPW